MDSYSSAKAAKEAFVTGLSGTSKLEIWAIVSNISLSIIICERVKLKQHPAVRLALEMLLIIYPQLLICTGALPLWPTLFVSSVVATAHCFEVATRPCWKGLHELPGLEDLAGRRKSFVGIFRGALMAATCLCILAVDFRAFPRRYAKAETYGTGYMDVGVGGVVLTAGLVSPAGLSYTSVTEGGDGSNAGKDLVARRRRRTPSLLRRLSSGLRGAAVCWMLGLARLVTTRTVDYQEHVGEYGVHWNFFCTIAVVTLLGHAVVVPPTLLAPAAISLTCTHQAVLSLGGLGPWVMATKRGVDLVSLNKEGLVSCVGFWALYLWGAALAHAFHVSVQPAVQQLQQRRCNGDAPPGTGGGGDGGGGGGEGGGGGGGGGCSSSATTTAAAASVVRWWVPLVIADGILWIAVAALEVKVEPISRRSCNAAYIVWVVAQCLSGLLPLAMWQALVTLSFLRGGGSGSGSGGSRDLSGDGGGGRAGPGGIFIIGGREPPGSRLAVCEGLSSGWRGGKIMGAGVGEGGELGAASWSREGKFGPRVLQAINSNQLTIFLVANLLTGALNLSVDTLKVADWSARALLGVYMSCLCGLAVLMDAYGLRIKV